MAGIFFQCLFVFHHVDVVDGTRIKRHHLFPCGYFTIKYEQRLWSIRFSKYYLWSILRHLFILTEDKNAVLVLIVPLRITSRIRTMNDFIQLITKRLTILDFFKCCHMVVKEYPTNGKLQWLPGIRLAFARKSCDATKLVNDGMQRKRTVCCRFCFGLHLDSRIIHLYLSFLTTFLHNFLLLLLGVFIDIVVYGLGI